MNEWDVLQGLKRFQERGKSIPIVGLIQVGIIIIVQWREIIFMLETPKTGILLLVCIEIPKTTAEKFYTSVHIAKLGEITTPKLHWIADLST